MSKAQRVYRKKAASSDDDIDEHELEKTRCVVRSVKYECIFRS